MMLKFIDITELGKSRVYGFMNVITDIISLIQV